MRVVPLVVLLLAVACGGSDGEAPAGQLSLRPSTTTTTTPEVAALAARLPTEVGEGFTRADDIVGAGALDLEDAATSAADPTTERRLLRRHGFRHGVSRTWIAAGGATIYIALYEFGAEAGAAAYDDAQAAQVSARGAEPFTSSAGRGFTTVEGELTTHAVLVRRGTTWGLVLAASEDASLSPDAATAVAAQL